MRQIEVMANSVQIFERASYVKSAFMCMSHSMRTSWLPALAALLAIFLLSGCDQRRDWHQKMSLTVETPDGVKSALSVIEVKSRYVGPDSMGNEVFYGLRGEAVTMEIAPGRYLFVLLEESFSELYYRSSPESFSNPKNRGKWLAEMPSMREVVNVPWDRFPMLVTFDDIKNPASVKRVNPSKLAASFGQGYRFKSITLEITDEPVTEGRIGGVLGWLEQLEGGYLHGGFTSKGAPLGLTGLEFVRKKK